MILDYEERVVALDNAYIELGKATDNETMKIALIVLRAIFPNISEWRKRNENSKDQD